MPTLWRLAHLACGACSARRDIRRGTPLSFGDARRLVDGYVEHYNNIRLNSATGYITPTDMLAGRRQEIHAERDRKLAEARKQRQIRRQQAACGTGGVAVL